VDHAVFQQVAEHLEQQAPVSIDGAGLDFAELELPAAILDGGAVEFDDAFHQFLEIEDREAFQALAALDFR
jgi:hypothetical protein